MSLRGKCALVTGSTGGLGRVVAEHFAAEGCNVILNGVVPEAEMTAALADLETAHGIKARYDRADLRKPDEIADMMDRASTRSAPSISWSTMPWCGTSRRSKAFRSSDGTRRSRSIYRRYSIPSGWRYR